MITLSDSSIFTVYLTEPNISKNVIQKYYFENWDFHLLTEKSHISGDESSLLTLTLMLIQRAGKQSYLLLAVADSELRVKTKH